jgi:hypothetical protein
MVAPAENLPPAPQAYEDTLRGVEGVPNAAGVLVRLLHRLANCGLHAGSPPLFQRESSENQTK